MTKVSREEHPVTTVLLHWAHLISFVVLVYSGLKIHSLPFGAETPPSLDKLHMAMWVVFLLSAFWRFVWSFMGDGSASHGSHQVEEDWHHFLFHKGDLKLAGQWLVAYLTFRRRELPEFQKYNPLQRVVYAIAFPLLIAAVALTGFALWPTTQATFQWMTNLLGTEEAVRQAHYFNMIGLIVITALHLYAAFFAGISRVTAMLLRWAPKGELVED